MKHSKPDVVIESSILVLGLLSYVHSKKAYVRIFTEIEKVFIYYIDNILNNESKLVKIRYTLFLGYLIDVLFKKEPQTIKNTILYLYNSVNLGGDDKALAL